MKPVVSLELLRCAVGKLGEGSHAAPCVFDRRLDENVDVFRQPDDALERQRIAPDERILDLLRFEQPRYLEEVLTWRLGYDPHNKTVFTHNEREIPGVSPNDVLALLNKGNYDAYFVNASETHDCTTKAPVKLRSEPFDVGAEGFDVAIRGKTGKHKEASRLETSALGTVVAVQRGL